MKSILRNFFWFCAGVNRQILMDCNTEHSKYVVIGATVFFTACFASISGAYALFFVFSGAPYAIYASLGFGLLWGLMIFNIDRYLVISLRKENKPRREFFIALPRFLLAIMIGIVIARPLELKIFDKEIKKGLKQYYVENQEELERAKNDNFNNQFKDVIGLLQQKEAEKSDAYSKWESEKELRDREKNGDKTPRTTGKVGWGRETEKLQLEVDKKGTIYDTLDNQVGYWESFLNRKRDSAGLNSVTFLDDKALEKLVSDAGFHDRNKILGQISSWAPWDFLFDEDEATVVKKVDAGGNTKKTSKVDSAGRADSTNSIAVVKPDNVQRLTQQRFDGKNDKTVFFISMLFVLIECLPIIVKLLSRRGTYDMRLEEEEERLQFLTRHETYANKHLIQELAMAQREVMTKAIEQWEQEEINSPTLSSRYININEN